MLQCLQTSVQRKELLQLLNPNFQVKHLIAACIIQHATSWIFALNREHSLYMWHTPLPHLRRHASQEDQINYVSKHMQSVPSSCLQVDIIANFSPPPAVGSDAYNIQYTSTFLYGSYNSTLRSDSQVCSLACMFDQPFWLKPHVRDSSISAFPALTLHQKGAVFA